MSTGFICADRELCKVVAWRKSVASSTGVFRAPFEATKSPASWISSIAQLDGLDDLRRDLDDLKTDVNAVQRTAALHAIRFIRLIPAR